MRKYLLILFLSFSFCLHAQKTYTAKELSRLADLGKIWGMLHNFHPEMARSVASTDSLVIDVAASLANDPSKENFEICLRTMLARVKDPLTHVVTDKTTVPVKLFTTNDSLPSYKLLADSILYVAFPTNFVFNDSIKKMEWLQPQYLGSYKGLILDLRNKTGGYYNGDNAFMQYTGDLIVRSMIKEPLSNIIPLYRYQYGFLDQASQSPVNNIYSAGWLTNMSDVMKPAAGFETWKSKVVFVINRFSTDQLIQYMFALQSAGYCKIIFDGDSEDYNNGMAVDYFTHADSIHLKLRVADYLGANNAYIGDPDLFINNITDETTFLEKCSQLIQESREGKTTSKIKSPMEYAQPYPTIYNTGFVSVGLRLFGLYNYWHAIEYFAPNKYLIKEPWDSVLTNFIPKFINANDSVSYYLVIRELASHIHDSHGFFGNEPTIQALNESYKYKLPFSIKNIENHYVIVDIGKDSLQDLSSFKLWDEIIAINDTPVNIYKEKFRTRFATSNEATFERDVCSNYLLSGAHDSKIQFTITRNGKSIKLDAKRTMLSFQSNYKKIDFNDDHKDIELLPNNIGYVNMGSLTNDRVDKLFDTLMNTKAIIFDIRNYPKGTAWGIVPRLTDHDSIAVKFDKPFVTFESIYSTPAIVNRNEFFTVYADKTKPFYKGKIIMLCNAVTQSQAEYTIMMFQGAAGKRVTVIGSTTAGADGNVTAITLPGGYSTYFSGLGVLYPDGAQTQQKGIRIDIFSKPTVARLKENKDEVLERAIQFANTGK